VGTLSSSISKDRGTRSSEKRIERTTWEEIRKNYVAERGEVSTGGMGYMKRNVVKFEKRQSPKEGSFVSNSEGVAY